MIRPFSHKFFGKGFPNIFSMMGHFHRCFFTREEQIAWLEECKQELTSEINAVDEEIQKLKDKITVK